MVRRCWWMIGIVGGILFWLGMGCTPEVPKATTVDVPALPNRHNILFIHCTKLSTRGLGCYGNPEVYTPHLDNLAKQGVIFLRAYCNAPMGNPSRASFCTGVRPDHLKILTNRDLMNWKIPVIYQGLGAVLKPGRAYMANVGDLYYPVEANRHYQAFDQLEYCEIPAVYPGVSVTRGRKNKCNEQRFAYSADPQLEETLLARETVFQKQSEIRSVDDPNWWEEVGAPYLGLKYQLLGDSGRPESCEEDYRKARIAGDIIRQCKEKNRLFFLSVGFSKPDVPLVAPQPYMDLYDVNSLSLSVTLAKNDLHMPAAAKRFGVKPDLFMDRYNETFPQLRETPQRQKLALASYYASASFMDAQVGYLLAVLQETGLSKNTIIVFTADHGFHLGEHGLWSDSTQFEEVTRVPLIVFLPEAAGNGQACDEIVELVDLMPTFCNFWTIPAPDYCEGTSFVPLLHEPKQTWKRASFNVFSMKGIAQRDIIAKTVRTKRYRYTEWGEEGQYGIELYDLVADPFEQVNQAYHRKYKQIRTRLAQGLKLGWSVALPEHEGGGVAINGRIH